MAPEPQPAWGRGRKHTEFRKVRLGDVTPEAVLRLDALARYAQDVSDDDTTDAGLDDYPSWVVRRTTIDAISPAGLAEGLDFTTFCSGLGRRWAERRLKVVGQHGAHYEIASLWICIDHLSGRPVPLTDQFLCLFGDAAGERKVNARLVHPRPPAEAKVLPWPLRAVDFDVLGHVNNAAYWVVVEELLAAEPISAPYRATIEYAAGISPFDQIELSYQTSNGELGLWWYRNDGVLAASASVRPLPAGLY